MQQGQRGALARRTKLGDDGNQIGAHSALSIPHLNGSFPEFSLGWTIGAIGVCMSLMPENSNKIAPVNPTAEIVPKIVEALKKQKGYASFFDWPNKATKEKGIVRDLLKAMEAKGEYHGVVKLKSNKPDPPDCVGVVENGELVGFEVTELVDQETVRKNRQGKRTRKKWTPNELLAKLREIVREKDSKKYHGGSYSKIILVIHTDEPFVRSADCDSILRGQLVGQCRQITDGYLLLSYKPRRKSYPYFKLELGRLV